MIHTDFDWTGPLNLLLLVAALALLALQCVLLYMRHRHSGRLGIRLILNVLLWLSMIAWILDPYFKSKTGSKVGLLIAGNVPSEVAGRIRDSLAGAEVVGADEVANRQVDTLVIIGQEFDDKIFASVRQLKNLPICIGNPTFRRAGYATFIGKGSCEKAKCSVLKAKFKLRPQRHCMCATRAARSTA